MGAQLTAAARENLSLHREVHLAACEWMQILPAYNFR